MSTNPPVRVVTNPTVRVATEFKPKYEIKVDLDDRAFLFPAGKSISQLLFLSNGKKIYVEAAYPFNQSRTPPRLLSLELEDAKELGRRLVEAVYHARTQLVVTAGVRITINVVGNGYHLQIGDMNAATELFLSTGCIWRVCQGILRISDLIFSRGIELNRFRQDAPVLWLPTVSFMILGRRSLRGDR